MYTAYKTFCDGFFYHKNTLTANLSFALQYSSSQLSCIMVWIIIHKLAKKVNLNKRIYPHIFRHSFATHLLMGGGDLRVVQELLGHASIIMTQKYTQVDHHRLKKQYNQLHPRS